MRKSCAVFGLAAALAACSAPPKPVDAGTCGARQPTSAVPPWTPDRQPFELVVVSLFGDCGIAESARTVDAEVWSTTGVTVASQVTSLAASDGYTVVHVAVPALPAGRYRWSVKFEPGLGVQSGDFYVVERRFDAGVVEETYVDNMETCWAMPPVRTTRGATLCSRGAELWVYRDGGIEDHFTGVDQAVLGEEIWSSVGDQLEHRVDTGSALRVDGRATVQFGGNGDLGENGPGRAVRSINQGAVEVSFDAGVLVSRELDLDWDYAPPGIRVIEGDELWLVDTGFQPGPCRVQRGCQQTTCSPVIECYTPATSTVALSVDERGLFRLETRAGVNRIELAWYPRPFDLAAQVAARGAAPTGTLLLNNVPSSWMVVAGAAGWAQADGTVLVARPEGEDFVLEWYDLRGAQPLWATRDWVVGKLGPRTLRFISRH